MINLLWSLPLERWNCRFLECQLGSWLGEWSAIWLNKEQKIPVRLIYGAFIVKLMPAKNKYASKSRAHGSTVLPPRLHIHSAKTAASLCSVTFSFPLSLVLLVRPAEHRDHSFISLLEGNLASCFEAALNTFLYVQKPGLDTQLVLLEDCEFRECLCV